MKKNKSFISRQIADEFVLVPSSDTAQEFNGMITLTETGSFIWNHIEEVDSFKTLVDKILDEYEVDRDTAAADASNFISVLLENEMIIPSGENW